MLYYNIQLSQAASIHIVFVVESALFHITTRRNTIGCNLFKYLAQQLVSKYQVICSC